jgi:Flp pilus assembly protein TadG
MIGALSPKRLFARFLRSQAGTATVEFVILVPLVLMMLFSSIDYGVVMMRQVFLDRAVDMAAREVRLGQLTGGFNAFRDRICERTFLLNNCQQTIAIEMRPIVTATWAGLNQPAQCVNRAEEVAPMLEFNPGAGLQELMLIRVCVAADPFIQLTGMILGMNELPSGGYAVVARTAWVNEPL